MQLSDAERREGLGVDRRVGERPEELPGERPGDHDGPALGREVDDVRAELEAVGAVAQPGFHPVRAARSSR